MHKLGEEAWNFYGPDEDSTTGVRIYNVSIRDLRLAPIQVPALAHSQVSALAAAEEGAGKREERSSSRN